MKQYKPKEIEDKWAKVWAESGIYKAQAASSDLKKMHVLDMFPYPSGEGLHIGHTKIFTASDVYSRFKRMQGFNVLHATGWDAYGLPAEQYAIKNKVNPKISTEKNINTFRRQMQMLGLSYDWDREVNTTDPEFYKWTQWIFLKLWEKGLVKEIYEPINWCPSCKTGLANEDLEDGKCERCGSVVEKKPLRQFSIEITKYAEKLLEGLEDLNWKENVKDLERNWIGKSTGSEIDFKIKADNFEDKFTVFTTRADTLFGCTYTVLAPEHDLVIRLLESNFITNINEVKKYIEEVNLKTEIERSAEGKEKTGVKLEGVTAINPANGEEVPVYIADYVLASYGAGAIMAVPAHDERDFEFAKKYNIEIKQVVEAEDYLEEKLFSGDGVLVNSSEFDGMESEEARKKITEAVGGKLVTKYKLRDWIFARQRYWGEPFPLVHVEEIAEFTDISFKKEEKFSNKNGIVALIKHWSEDKYLGVKWKKVNWQTLLTGGLEAGEDAMNAVKREITEETGYKNFKDINWITDYKSYFYHAPKNDNRCLSSNCYFVQLADGEKLQVSDAENENHELVWLSKEEILNFNLPEPHQYVLDIFFKNKSQKKIYPIDESDLPVLLPDVENYEPTGTGESPLSNIDEWVNVTGYITDKGTFKVDANGKVKAKRETNTMPQWAGSSWYWLRYMDAKNKDRFVGRDEEKYWGQVDVYLGGLEHATRHLIYARFWHRFLYDIGELSTPEPFKRLEGVGLVLGESGAKMSKRLGNVINPDDVADRWGVDTLRTYILFMGPYHDSVSWNSQNLIGPRRFLERVWDMQFNLKDESLDKETEILLNQTIKKLSEDNEALRFNTGVSSLMILLNALEKDVVSKEVYEVFLKLLAPYAPFMTEEIWGSLGNDKSIHISKWPDYDENKLQSDNVIIAVQINGKVRGTVNVANNASQDEVLNMVKDEEVYKKWVGENVVKKVIFVQNKILNLIV